MHEGAGEIAVTSRAVTVASLVAGASAALYALVAGSAFLMQRAMIYPAPAFPVEPSAPGATLERFSDANGTAGYALYAPAPPGAPTVVHFHGNGEDLAGQALLIGHLQRAGLGVFAVEYPGYGVAAGVPRDETSIYATAEAAIRHLVTLGVARDAIVLQGQSLGTGVAVEMARRGHGVRLVLISPYTSMVDMARLVTPFLPVSWLVLDRYENERKAPSLALPALVVHGTDDEVVPFRMGERVASLLPHAEFFPVPRGHHNDIFDGDVDVLAKIAAFARGTDKGAPKR